MSNNRVVIEKVEPQIDCGRFPIKRIEGDLVAVEADIFADGHELLGAALLYKRERDKEWRQAPMSFWDNDRWRGDFRVGGMGRYAYTVRAWVDHFASWRRDLEKRAEAGQDLGVDLLIGADLIEAAALRARGSDAEELQGIAAALEAAAQETRLEIAIKDRLSKLMAAYPDLSRATTYEREVEVVVDRPKARFSTWYELFPRSCSPEAGRHGTFKDVERQLPRIAGMGFDVVYLPPIHPIGKAFRKGANNNPLGSAGDPGSPWAIGSEEGGHKAIHPELGTLEDFRGLVLAAVDQGMEIALDIAFQCSPDHPYVREHPTWFRARPDGTIQYAENPPKKYHDIYPFDFESEDWRAMWTELKSIFDYWIEQGVRIFRVDNPHSKFFQFWEWAIGAIKAEHPDVLFLSEAFTRPKVMYQLAKLGFSQSYTYFTWRNEKWEFEEYFTELTQTGVKEFFRPNLWPNTPDILPEHLQSGGRPAFEARLLLAATLGASYGVYAPAFELMEHEPAQPGSEEYLNSEKYEIRNWNLDDPRSLKETITAVNRVRAQHPALQSNDGLRFHETGNDKLLAYSKSSPDGVNRVLAIVSLDLEEPQEGRLELSAFELKSPALSDLYNGVACGIDGETLWVNIDPRSSSGLLVGLEGAVNP